MKKPKVTVLMSVYNGERYLHESIESILNQTFKDFGFLIINDGSTDNTPKILKSYKDQRIKIISNKNNLGLTKSLNKGIKLAKGEYIARQDVDDVSLSERLEKQVKFLNSYPSYAAVGTFTKIINEDSKVIFLLRNPIYFHEIKRALMINNCIVHGSIMMRKNCLLETSFYDESMKRSQDYELWLRLSEKYKLANLPEFLYLWRKHEGNIEAKHKREQEMYVEIAKAKARERGIWKFDKLGYQIKRISNLFAPKTF